MSSGNEQMEKKKPQKSFSPFATNIEIRERERLGERTALPSALQMGALWFTLPFFREAYVILRASLVRCACTNKIIAPKKLFLNLHPLSSQNKQNKPFKPKSFIFTRTVSRDAHRASLENKRNVAVPKRFCAGMIARGKRLFFRE